MGFHEEDDDIIRSSRSQMLLKIGVLKKFTTFTGKHLCWILFLIKLLALMPATLFKRVSQTGFFLYVHCENFKHTFFYTTPLVAAFLLSYCFSQRTLSCTSVINLTFSFVRNMALIFSLTYFLYLLFPQLCSNNNKIIMLNWFFCNESIESLIIQL